MGRPAGTFDVDFSFALRNRTGKYFIGRDLLTGLSDLLVSTHYWFIRSSSVPAGRRGRLIARAEHLHVRINSLLPPPVRLPRRRARRRVLHLDPCSVLTSRLTPGDVVLCHDVGPLSRPELFGPTVTSIYRAAYREIARVRPHMVFVSEASRRAFHDLHPRVPFPSSRVIYPPVRADVGAGAGRRPAMVPGRFLLTVGTFGARKNQAATIRAFARSGLAERGFTYVLCGADELGHEDAAAAAAETPGVVRLPYVSDAELRWLYRNASGFVLMSFLEGFGIPVAEAISYGLVPLIPATGALAEVAGHGAITADPIDTRSIGEGMGRLADLGDAEQSSRLRLLRESLQRFDGDDFIAAWRETLTAVAAGQGPDGGGRSIATDHRVP